ncbi:MAG: TolC family protein [Kiritimatiellae bacterium]|nr:TolC family protein [Kiritimatiellia bacterium]
MSIYRYAVPFFSVLFIVGCSTVKKARQAQTGTNRSPGETIASAAQIGFPPGGRYALTNFEAVARTHHPSLFQARQNVESARLQYRMTHSSRLPQITASGTYNRSTQNARRDTSTGMRGSWGGSLGLDLLLYDFGKLDAGERQALESLIAAEEQLRETGLDVAYNVRAAFFEYHRSDELVRVAVESERQYAQHLEEARVMVEVGTRRRYDVTKAEVDLGNARLTLITTSNALINARAELNRSLGLAEQTAFDVGDGFLPPHPGSADTLMTTARDNAPALAVLRARERAASAYVDQTIADLYPDLSLGANGDLSGRGFPLLWNFSWALRLTQNLFDGHRKTARIDEAVTQLRTARSRVADAEQTLYQNLVNAVAELESANKRLETSQLVRRQTEENLAIVNEQYRVGVSSSIERTDAQVALTQAQADVVRARYDGQVACARIARLTGEGTREPEQTD